MQVSRLTIQVFAKIHYVIVWPSDLPLWFLVENSDFMLVRCYLLRWILLVHGLSLAYFELIVELPGECNVHEEEVRVESSIYHVHDSDNQIFLYEGGQWNVEDGEVSRQGDASKRNDHETKIGKDISPKNASF